jgi:uncharacterized protein
MKILITGGTGFVGSALAGRLLSAGHRVTVTSSRESAGLGEHPDFRHLIADTSKQGDWQEIVAEQDVLVNLAGRPIFHLWTKEYREEIRNSRILTTRNLVEAMAENSKAVLLTASAVGFYGDGGEFEKDESAPSGNGFLAEVCRAWETEAKKAERKGVRVAIMRFGVILGEGGGAISTMKMPFEMGLGGPIGKGRQWFPWIHIEDLIGAFFFLLSRDAHRGTYNFVAPGIVRQKEFASLLGRALHRPAVMPAPSWAMKLTLGEFGKSLLQGQKAVPKALLQQGYTFLYPKLQPAVQDILGG